MTRLIVFVDGGGRLGPLTDLRASFEVRTGALTTLERIVAWSERTMGAALAGVWTPPEAPPDAPPETPPGTAALTRERLGVLVNDPAVADAAGDVLLVNGRCVVPPDELARLGEGEALIEPGSGEIVGVRLAGRCRGLFEGGTRADRLRQREAGERCLLHRPWDVVRFRDRALDMDLAWMVAGATQELPEGVIAIGEHPVRISPEATVYPTAVLDAEGGPIVIEDHAVVRPGATIIGPAFVGRGSTVLDQALIKAHSAIGPVCKVAGEVGGTIVQGYSNKAHDGHIGDSWLGEWVNLGAGTTNSNLLNTYGEVTSAVEPGAARERTGLNFLGSIVGDHTKTAIMTRLMTGAVIGTGCMVATTASPPSPLGRFEWVTDERRQHYRFAKFMEAARAAMARRRVAPSAAYEARLRGLCEASARGAARAT
ncbi:MAG TPA: hypothetical protein DEB06_02610 [Phycisphaerales bacterium]|nr:hypothetical protein [Phycisphaerales bacterium]